MRIVITLLILLAAGSGYLVAQGPAQSFQRAPDGVIIETHPRYQIVFRANTRADTFLLDTREGRIWRLAAFQDIQGAPEAWDSMWRIDDTKSFLDFARAHNSDGKTEWNRTIDSLTPKVR